MNEIELLEQLKRDYPHLYQFQVEIQRIVNATGFGDVSASCVVRHRKVFSTDVGGWIKKLHT